MSRHRSCARFAIPRKTSFEKLKGDGVNGWPWRIGWWGHAVRGRVDDLRYDTTVSLLCFELSIVSSLVLLGFVALAISGVYFALSFLYRLICIYTWLCKRLVVDLSGYVNHVHWSSASHRPCRSPAESPGFADLGLHRHSLGVSVTNTARSGHLQWLGSRVLAYPPFIR